MSRDFLPYGRQWIGDDDVAAVAKVLRGDFLTTGPAVEAFEAALAGRVGSRYAVACSSGTAALHLAAMVCDLEPGDAVVVPAITFMGSANVVRHLGAEVVFADVDPKTGLMRAADLEAALARAGNLRVRSGVAVHLNGQTADMAAIAAVAGASGVRLTEDAAHALGAASADTGDTWNEVGCGRLAETTIFSFHPVKTATSGEGGAVTTNDPALAARLRRLRSHGIVREPEDFTDLAAARDVRGEPNPWYHEMHEPGLNYRISDIHCALGLSQLAKLDMFVESRGRLAQRYDAALARLAPAVRPVARVDGCRPAWHLYAVHIDFPAIGMDRAELMHRLRERRVGTQVHYIPVHRQPYYRRRYPGLDLPGADAYYGKVLSLPLFHGMADADVDYVADTLAAIIGG